MPPFALQDSLERILAALAALAVSGGAVVWLWIAVRVCRRQPVVPRRRRRPVPWGLSELLVILIVFMGVLVGAHLVARAVLGPEVTEPPAMYDVDEADAQHLITRLIEHAAANPLVFLLCTFSAVVSAPIAEEFLYRLLLQGWLEKLWRRGRRRMPLLRRLLPGASGPILLVALLFARAHFRVTQAPVDPRLGIFTLAGLSAVYAVTIVFAVLFLRFRVGATAADLGWDARRLPGDAALGVLAFLAVVGPLYAAQVGLLWLLPDYLPPDPFTLFPFALVLGYMYHRTHRLAPSVCLHASFNAAAMFLAWLTIVGR